MASTETVHANIALTAFLVTSLAVIALSTRAITLRIPYTNRNVQIGFGYPTVIAVVLLLLTGTIGWEDVWVGVYGDEHISPFAIVILFMSFAFMCGSMDMTGIFAYVGLLITSWTHGSCLKAYFAYYALSSVLTLFTSNDIVIMTLTPIIYYYASTTGIDPVPFLLTSFFAANIMSAAILVGNPTNIIVSEAFSVTFLSYSKWMTIPSLVGSVTSALVGLWYFRGTFSQFVTLPDIHARSVLRDTKSAIFGTVNLLLCLVGLVCAPWLGVSIWHVTLLFGMTQLVYNALHYPSALLHYVTKRKEVTASPHSAMTPELPALSSSQTERAAVYDTNCQKDIPVISESQGTTITRRTSPRKSPSRRAPQLTTTSVTTESGKYIENKTGGSTVKGDTKLQTKHKPKSRASRKQETAEQDIPAAMPHTAEMIIFNLQENAKNSAFSGTSEAESSAVGVFSTEEKDANSKDPLGSMIQRPQRKQQLPGGVETHLQTVEPSFRRAITSLPWAVVPFALGMFILVQSLEVTGWIDYFAEHLSKAMNGTIATMALMCTVGILAVNILTAQPMTILMTRVLLSPKFIVNHGDKTAAMYSLVIASNYGTNFSLIGCLAGIMWAKILSKKGVSISYTSFAKHGILLNLPVVFVALLTLYIECIYYEVPAEDSVHREAAVQHVPMSRRLDDLDFQLSAAWGGDSSAHAMMRGISRR